MEKEMQKKHVGKILLAVARAVIICGMAMLVLLPFPTRKSTAAETYLCLWEDGTETEESYNAAFDAYDGADEETVFLLREGKRGQIAAGEKYRGFMRTARHEGITQILAANTNGMTRIEKLAAYRVLAGTVFISGGQSFAFSGEGFSDTTKKRAQEIALLDGTLSAKRILEAGATALSIGAEATVTAATLDGTNIERVRAASPYLVNDGAIYLETAFKRLVCGIPAARDLSLLDFDYADEGALLPCRELRSLDLPFVGSAKSGGGMHGELAFLFSAGTEYRVPDTLKRVTVRGGTLVSYAFYRCTSLEEIDASALRAEDVETDAFLGCTNLRTLLSPRADVNLPGTFRATPLPNGCTLFERV